MKNLYHLFVTSYKLHVTSYKLHIARFKRFTSHLLPHTSYLFLFFPFSVLAQTQEATVTDVVFSCPGTVTVTYNLVSCNPVDVTLYYSSENCGWSPAVTEENVQPGTGKTITWDAAADNVSFGKFYYKVEYSVTLPDEPDYVTINGVKWSPVNLDVGGWFCANPWDYGGYYQWGRQADGHECPTSATTTTLSSTDNPGHSNFIINTSTPFDWRTPQNDFLWNSGTAAVPVKTANDPCPAGWRVPTQAELETLGVPFTNQTYVTKVWTTQNGINGYLCIDNNNGNSLFLPFAEGRANSNAHYDYYTIYWSSTTGGSSASTLYFDAFNHFNMTSYARANGLSVRCVHE